MHCSNCNADVREDDLLLYHQRVMIGAICKTCLEGVKKPRVTFVRTAHDAPVQVEQYACVETF